MDELPGATSSTRWGKESLPSATPIGSFPYEGTSQKSGTVFGTNREARCLELGFGISWLNILAIMFSTEPSASVDMFVQGNEVTCFSTLRPSQSDPRPHSRKFVHRLCSTVGEFAE